MVLIGRFRPFHKSHESLIKEALLKAPYVLVLVGSSFQPANTKNPWSYLEVAEMIHTKFDPQKVIVFPLTDKDSDIEWSANVKEIVGLASRFLEPYFGREPIVSLTGHKKDESSYYLDLFPEWEFIPMKNTTGFNATAIREQFFKDGSFPKGYLSKEIEQYLIDWKNEYPYLYEELSNEFKKSNS